MRTSLTDPLQIAEIPIAEGFGKVGLTLCPGKKQSGAATGSWSRDLRLDLDSIARWNAAALVTLVEEAELTRLGVPDLGSAVQDDHLLWYHLPIQDAGIPDRQFETAWAIVGEHLRAMLRDGFNVLVHCKGGLGRAGTCASRLLIELGMAPADAVRAVRQVRRGAIETTAQLDYVMDLAPVPEAQPHGSVAAIRDRALGAMIGLAVGDAIGTTLEFAARDVNPRLDDMIGGGPFRLTPGEWTDDTAMALALMDSLVAHPALDEADLMRRFVDWHQNGTYSCTGRCFDIGVTTRIALARWQELGDPFAGSTNPRTAGNGSLMRLAPVAIRYWNDKAALRDVAARQSRTTHGAPEAVDACIAYAEVLSNAIAGVPRSSVCRISGEPGSDAIRSIMAGSWRGQSREVIRSSGYVVHALEAALWCVGRTGTFVDAVLLAANLGEDADTTAAITGQLAGALYGAEGISSAWRDQLAWGERISQTANRLFEASLVT